jgi:hypothetical protein
MRLAREDEREGAISLFALSATDYRLDQKVKRHWRWVPPADN